MQLPTRRRVLAVLAVLAATIAAIAPTTPAIAAPPAADATASALLDAFATHQIVALGQVHDLRQEDDFILDVLHHPRFADTVDSIVVEFGNARFQSRVDRYIAGEVVLRDVLRGTWEETTQISGIWSLPMYEDMLADIRAVNMALPVGKRFRVLLGDPPVD